MPNKSILKRDAQSFEECRPQMYKYNDQRHLGKAKSLEERRMEYVRTKERIWNNIKDGDHNTDHQYWYPHRSSSDSSDQSTKATRINPLLHIQSLVYFRKKRMIYVCAFFILFLFLFS